jgi:PAS domain S-box-containing protein
MTISNQVCEEEYKFAKAEAHFAAAIDNSSDGLITIDQAGNIFLFNATAEKLFGYSASEATKINFKELTPELFKGFHNGHIKNIWDSQQKIKIGSTIEVEAFHKNKTTFPALLKFSEFWIEKERHFSVTVKNISEKKLTEAHKFHEIAFDHVKEGILVIDLEGKISLINSIGASLLGYTAEELKGKSFYSTIYHLKTITNRFTGKDNIVLETIKDGIEKTVNDQIFLNKYGSFISVDFKLSPVVSDNKNLGVVIAFKNNELLVGSSLRTRVFFEMSKIISQSLSWENTINQTLQMIGKNLQWELANYWEIDSQKTTLKCLEQWKAPYLKSEAISNFQKISRNKTFAKLEGLPGEVWDKGQPVWISDILNRQNFPREPFAIKAGLHSGFGSPVYEGDQIIGVFEFFTSTPQEHLDANQVSLLVGLGGQLGQFKKRMESETDLIVAKEQAIKADNYKSEFLSQMSHELRTPLNAIIGFSQILMQSKRPVLDKKHVSDVSLILESGKHLLRLINEILDLSKIESGKMEVSIEPINLNKLLTETMAFIRPMAQKANITLIDFMSGSEEITILADEFRLRQVILNLIANGVKYNKSGGSVTLNHEILNNHYVRINVQDTGYGIPEGFQNKIFNPFERGGAEFSQIEGTGIGLSVTKKLVELMRGKISFNSVENKGSCFYFDMPLAASSKQDINTPHPSIKESKTKQVGNKINIDILYIEDNVRNLELVKRIIEEQKGMKLVSAEDGISGLETAKKNLPDLILLDIHLPKMNGFEVFLQLKEIESTKNIPIIAVSANARDEDIKKASEMGFVDYLTKPLSVNALVEVLNKYKA